MPWRCGFFTPSGLHELGYDLSSKTHEAKNVYRVIHLLVLYHLVDSRGYREQ